MYQAALAYELEKRGLRITRQQAIPVVYETVQIIAPVHKKQLLTYLKLADKAWGYSLTPSASQLSRRTPRALGSSAAR